MRIFLSYLVVGWHNIWKMRLAEFNMSRWALSTLKSLIMCE
jgi:hypothetical protein